MFKKNIAKLLVFAMILSMLPFAMATENGQNATPAAQADETATATAYIVEGATENTIAGKAFSFTKGGDGDYTITADSNITTDDLKTSGLVVDFKVATSTGAGTAKVTAYQVTKDTASTKPTTNGKDVTPDSNGKVSCPFSDVKTADTYYLWFCVSVNDQTEYTWYKATVTVKAATVAKHKLTITAPDAAEGTITVTVDGESSPVTSGAEVEKGKTVKVVATAKTGYTYKSVTVTPASGSLTPTTNNDGCSFEMPDADVTVSATFEKDTPTQPETYTATFVVTDKADGKAVAGATIKVTPDVQVTDNKCTLNKGTKYTYTVSATGYTSKNGTVTEPTGDAKSVEVPVTLEADTKPPVEEKDKIKSIKITPETLTLDKSRRPEGTLTAEINHSYTTLPDVTWKSSDESVATVDEKGMSVTVTAVAEGTTNITVTCGGVTSEACKVSVSNEPIPVESVALKAKPSEPMKIGETLQLEAEVAPENAFNKTVTWESDNDKVATVKDGKVAAVGAGTATITVTTSDGKKTDSCEVTVLPEPTLTLDKQALTVKMGETASLTATVKDGNVLKWESSNEEVVKVTGNNETVTITPVTADQSATVTVTVTGNDYTKTASCKVTVVKADAKPVAPTISINLKEDEELKAIVGETALLSATATNYTKVEWTSSDPSVATVEDSKDGLSATITAVKEGKVTITATATGEGTATATCDFTVEAAKVGDAEIEKTEVAVKEAPKVSDTQEQTALNNAVAAIEKTDTAIAENLGSVVQAEAQVTGNNVSAGGVTVNTTDMKKALMGKDSEAKEEDIRTIIVPKIEIEVKGAEMKDGKAISLSFKVDAYAEVKVTFAKEGETLNNDNSVASNEKLPLNNTTKTISVNLPLPESFQMPKNPVVKHVKDSGGTFWHRAYKAEKGFGVWFKNNHGFSTLTVSEMPDDQEADHNGELYTSLSNVINNVAKDNDTIVILSDTSPVKVSREITFTLAYRDGVKPATIEAGEGYQVEQDGSTYKVTKKSTNNDKTPSGGGGGGGGSSKPAIKKDDKDKPTTPTTTPGGGVAGFNDVATSAWYADSVKYVVDKGLFGGVGNGNFAPNANMTRAMMWTVLARYMGVNTNTGSNWYEAARTWAMAQNISDGTMADGNVTREQFVTMLWRLSGEPAVETSASFTDNGSISGYAKTAVDWAVAQGILNGYNDGSFRPQGSATRAEVAKMLTVFCQNAENTETPENDEG